jgi:hypothetical protein
VKIDIIYRCCGKEVYPDQKRSSRPSWFDKLKCYKSVWDMTDKDPSTFSMHVIYDGYRTALLDYIEGMRVSDCAIYKVNKGGYESINDQYDLADKLTGDWIYFCEDDYLHAPDAARVMLEGANRFELLSLYDHLDRYTRTDDRTTGRETMALTSSCHWRTAESTCHTWAVRRDTWSVIRGFAIKHGANDRSFFYDLIEIGVRLWTPILARSTHCVKGYMSPLADWQSVSNGVSL